MEKKHKQLIITDVCARLPYGVKVHRFSDNTDIDIDIENFSRFLEYSEDDEFKPYLRSLSSITDNELKEVNEKFGNIGYFFKQEPPYDYGLMCQHADAGSIIITEFTEVYKWLIEHHFDVNDLIGKGIAIEAQEEIYKIK